MASEKILKELFEVAKRSSSFKGMPEKEVWDACLSYKDSSDDKIKNAIIKIKKKDDEDTEKAKMQKELIEENAKKLNELKEKEELDRGRDSINADKMLDEFFKP